MKSFHDEALEELPGRISSSARVLDVGGWHAPLNRANYMIDIMPYETRNKEGALNKSIWPTENFTQETYTQMDICAGAWPYPDKYFDFVYCSNTVEDLRDPIHVCKEMNRVAKAGFLEVPSRLVESTRGIERPFYCGYYHHRWLCEAEGTKMIFMFKPAMLSAYRKFHFSKPFFKKVNPLLEGTGFFWNGSFEYEEKILIDRADVQKDLVDFKKKSLEKGNLFVSKYHLRREPRFSSTLQTESA